MTWQSEFPDFPPEAMPNIPGNWEDTSWHHDECPCFEVRGDEGTPNLQVFVPYPHQELRYQVFRGLDLLYSGDDWEVVLDTVHSA